ncbi:MAG TPA: hypothetical protein VIE43_20315 [Thermoanaerobaculia bacterium]|nr:hypothetical protein [Thermoanaerobaculia bacterium]
MTNAWVRVAAAFFLALVLTGAAPAPPAGGSPGKPALGVIPQPRELSPAERAAAELAAAYFARGPEAWWDRLAADAPLRKLGREAALEEIGVRAGPADGSSWQLLTPGPKFGPQAAVFGIELPSGLDETLVLDLVDEGGWKISGVRITAEPLAVAPFAKIAPLAKAAAKRRASPAPASIAPSAPPIDRATLLRLAFGLFLTALIGAVASLGLAYTGKRRPALGVGGATAMLALGLGVCLWEASHAAAPRRASAPPPAPALVGDHAGLVRLAALAPLRRALADGGDRAEIERRLASPAADPALRGIQDLWHAQYLLLESDLNAAAGILDHVPAPASSSVRAPLGDLLHARLAFRRLQGQQTQELYDAAIADGLDVDALRLEAALARSLTDQDDLGDTELARLTATGSRLAEPWYAAARQAALEDRLEEAETLLLRAWTLEPIARGELFEDPVFAFLVTRPKLFPAFQFSQAEEPRTAFTGERHPMALPLRAQAVTCGESLHVAVGGAELEVPNGAGLAPEGTPVEDALIWNRHAEEKALAALPSLTQGMAAGATLPPRNLRIAQVAGRALADQNRWAELVTLTEPLAGDLAHAPALLVRLRAHALRQLDRREEARQLLIRLAKSDVAGRRPKAGTLLDLSELFAASGEYDTAIKLSEKADRQLPHPRGESRRKQLALDRDLAASYSSYKSEHFEVRYPKSTGDAYARGVTVVLEKERQRLAKWIPGAGNKPVEVYIFPYRDFFANFGGDMGVVGLFDGKVRVPFAEVKSLHPELVSILSHELAHAMIAAATHDRAPHWFQEGMAEHVEMGRGRLNPLPDLVRTDRVLAFPTIDPILRGFADPQLVDLAYGEAAWTINFIETRFGTAGLHRMLAAFAAGKSTDEAIQEVCHLSTPEFDRAFWEWGATKAPQTYEVDVRRYDLEIRAQTRREERQDVRAILRSGVSDSSRLGEEKKKAQADAARKKMEEWYAVYSAGAAEIKAAFLPIFQRYRQGKGADPIPGCTTLTRAVPALLDRPEILNSPDPLVNQSLRDAYRALGKLGNVCLSGRDNEMTFQIGEAENALSVAARLMAPYGLKP